ncbi:hypothetical protein BDM02DRAFT_3088406 [Thelephora ganbajun]|uniref:Uncharacterized protein n=1 Tax=Thelephora ganbajun TaxID=370292 RepID=A0ACB6ZU70_THEGA|nr:hypothetical protein BDM02DRAFT_3088406 [Thelephora ganbajun]
MKGPEEKTLPEPVSYSPQRCLGRSRLVSLLAGLGAFALINGYFRGTEPTVYYALCSPHGTANIYTVDPDNTKVQCLVVKDERFLHTSAYAELQEKHPGIHIKFLQHNSIVIPGITDSHVHALQYGLQKQLPLEGAAGVLDAVAKVRAYIESDPAVLNNRSTFIEGWGWDTTKWSTERWPTAAELEADPVTRGRLIALRSKDAHGCWVSQKILDIMEPIPEKVDGGVIVRDSSGKPVGVFLDNARDLIPIPPPTEEVLLKRWDPVVKDAHAVGLTAIHDALLQPNTIDFFHKQALEGNLALRVYGMKYFDDKSPYWGNTTKKIIGAGGDRFTLRSAKFVVDGALRSRGAALYEPYSDDPTNRGSMRVEPGTLNKTIPKFLEDGWQCIHAIGDRTNGVVLDALGAALEHADVPAIRPRIEHAQIMDHKDIPRLGKTGVIASVQPIHAISDMWYAEHRLGPERVKRLYAFRSIIDAGARTALGTDFPVEDMRPLATFYAATTRLSYDGDSPHGRGGWFPEQRMTRLEALRGMTIDPAFASFTENILGSIEPGKRADFVVLSKDIMEMPAEEILKTEVLATVMDGVVVYGKV